MVIFLTFFLIFLNFFVKCRFERRQYVGSKLRVCGRGNLLLVGLVLEESDWMEGRALLIELQHVTGEVRLGRQY